MKTLNSLDFDGSLKLNGEEYSSVTKKLQLKKIGQKHRDIMYRYVCGESFSEIRKDIGISQTRMSIIVNSPLFRLELRKLQREVEEKVVESVADVSLRIKKLAPKAVDVLENLVTKNKIGQYDVPLRLKKDAANDILELSGEYRKAKTGENGDGNGANGDKNGSSSFDFAKLVGDAFALAKENRQKLIVNQQQQINVFVQQNQPTPINLNKDDGNGIIDHNDASVVNSEERSLQLTTEEDSFLGTSNTRPDTTLNHATSPSPILSISNLTEEEDIGRKSEFGEGDEDFETLKNSGEFEEIQDSSPSTGQTELEEDEFRVLDKTTLDSDQDPTFNKEENPQRPLPDNLYKDREDHTGDVFFEKESSLTEGGSSEEKIQEIFNLEPASPNTTIKSIIDEHLKTLGL